MCKSVLKSIVLMMTFIVLSVAIAGPKTKGSDPLAGSRSMIILDAGSTGTRLHVFRYAVDPYNPTEIRWIKEVSHKKIIPGLATIAGQQQDLSDASTKQQHLQHYLVPLLRAANQVLTPNERRTTPVYLFATAGVRNLSDKAREEALTATTDALIDALKQSGYPFPDNKPHDAINAITGTAEGLFSWITINYLMQHYEGTHLEVHHGYGVLDLGGASTQISVQQDNPDDKKDSMYLQRGKNRYAIYVHSYPTYGAYFSQAPFKQHYGNAAEVCFLQSGKANFQACQKLVADYIYKGKDYEQCVAAHDALHCSKMGEYQPDLSQTQFFIISYYYDIFARLDLVPNIPSPGLLAMAGQKYCARSWADVKSAYQNQADSTLNSNCFISAWAYTLLKGYGLRDDTPLLASDKISGVSTDWPLGAAIYLITQPKHQQSIYLAS